MKPEDLLMQEIDITIEDILFTSELMKFNWSVENKLFLKIVADEALDKAKGKVKEFFERGKGGEIFMLDNHVVIAVNTPRNDIGVKLHYFDGDIYDNKMNNELIKKIEDSVPVKRQHIVRIAFDVIFKHFNDQGMDPVLRKLVEHFIDLKKQTAYFTHSVY
jgi:hypothetical protein